ncbi:MAG: NirD/YgiW/YdeI family stress tolerance protein [Planctomycetes bacterium]|nr:NirD/YgiW/YdeI family stress tolerance protein [Planctomycetota bacterium]
MKIRYMIITALAVSLIAVPLLFSAEEEIEITTIADAKELPDDTEVTLKGYVVEKLRDEYYLFRDDTDQIELEIKKHHWKDREMDPGQLVHIHGEVDRDDDDDDDDDGSFEIEVKELEFPE